VARLELEQDLRRGIEKDELVVHYQPIVDVETGDAERYEALIRWNHPVRGMIHPADFLSVAAESSLIVDIGNLVLRRACHQAVRWSEMTGRPITVAVNVAERQLLDLGLVGSVTRALAESGLPPQQLELEITEELIMERLDRALLVLRQLELAGVKLVIDDFGTSQASLARLQSLAMVSTLKIDRVFVEGLANESVDRNIVTAIVSLASGIGMSIVAEGVEQQGQADVLRSLGVRYQQGFLYQRPGPPEKMTRYLHRLQHGSGTLIDHETFDAEVAKAMFDHQAIDHPLGD
jgi:EAL domain-containing protein (putative c-di-GMP-specific phosphodiesterase class I)